MERAIERGNLCVAPVDGQRVLGQIVATHAEKGDVAGELRSLERGGRYLDHDTQFGASAYLGLQLFQKGGDLVYLGEFGDHGQHDGQPAGGGGAEQSAQLSWGWASV